MAMALELAADRCALLVVELQNDMVHESNIGKRGLGGRLARKSRGAPFSTRPLGCSRRCARPAFPRSTSTCA